MKYTKKFCLIQKKPRFSTSNLCCKPPIVFELQTERKLSRYRNASNKNTRGVYEILEGGLEGGLFFQRGRLFHIKRNDKNMIVNE